MSDQELARDLGFLEAYTLGLGTMIGAGIFVLPGIVAAAAGPASMVAFAIGGVVALLAALSLSELATGMPKAGGSYYYVNHALGSFFGTIVGWGMWGGLMFATAFYMLGFGQYLLNADSTAVSVVAAGLVMASILVAVNYRGVKETGSLQNYIVVTLVGLIAVFIVVGLFSVNIENLVDFAPQGWAAVGATAGTVFVTFIGFEVIATSAEEIKDPGRNLPLSMVAAVVTPTLLYVLVMFVSTGILPIDVLAGSDVPVAAVAELAAGVFGSVTLLGIITVEFSFVGWAIMIIGALLATVSSANASILSAARVNFAMGRDKILTNWLNQIHDDYRTPYRAIVVTGLVILALIAGPFPIDFLADVAAFMFLVTYALVHAAVVVLRRAEPEGYDPDFRIPSILYPAVPALGFVACLAVMVQMGDSVAAFTVPSTTVEVSLAPVSWVQLTGIGIIGVSILWYVFYSREKAISTTLVGEAVAPDIGEEEDIHRVVVGVANPETQRNLIRLAASSVKAEEPEGKTELVAVNIITVPPQTSPAQQREFEEERIEAQNELLENARTIADDLDIALRTRAIIARDIGETMVNIAVEENAEQVVMGWSGKKKRRHHVLGSNLDTVMENAPCEVTLVRTPQDGVGRVVALAGEGPYAPLAARRGYEYVSNADGQASLTLMNVQPITSENPEQEGQNVIEEVAERAGLEEDDYDTEVVETDNIRNAILNSVEDYETVCMGTTRQNAISRALFGSIPGEIGEKASGTVVMVSGGEQETKTVREAIVERIG